MYQVQFPILDFRWSFTGDKLAVVGNADSPDNRVRIYDKDLQLNGYLNSDYYDLNQLSWINTSDTIAAIITFIYDAGTDHVTYNSMIRVWDTKSKEIINDLSTELKHSPTLISASPNSRFLAAFIGNNKMPYINIWDVKSLEEVITIPVKNAIRNIYWDSTASSIVYLNYKDEYNLFDIRRGVSLWKKQITGLCQRKDYSLLGIDTQGRIKFWNMRNDTEGALFDEQSDKPMSSAKWNSDSKYVLSIDHYRQLYLWSIDEGFMDRPLVDGVVDKFFWSPDGTRFATIAKNTIRVHDIYQKKTNPTYQISDHHIIDIKWNPVRDRIAVETKNGISLWKLDGYVKDDAFLE